MADHLQRPVSGAAVWARRLASFSAVLFLTAALAHRHFYLETPGFIAVLGVVVLLAILALVLALRGFARLWNHGDLGGKNLTFAFLICAVVLAPFGLSLYRAMSHPKLTDISTDLDDPPQLTAAAAARTGAMNAIRPYTPEERSLQLENYPLVTGRRYEMPFGRVLETVNKIVEDMGWTIVSPPPPSDAAEVTIEAVTYTSSLGFPGDVAIRLTDEDLSTYVDMRSASRFGEYDLGDNANRINGFLTELDDEISALAGVLPAEPAEAEPAEPGEIPLPQPKPQN